jgi:hypothetical protein
MDIVKKNWLSILFGVIAIAAIVGDFYPMNGLREKLKTEASARAAVAGQLQELSTKQRNKPIVDLKSTDPVPLTSYPIDGTIENARKATELVAKAAVDVLNKASTLNQHAPLEANSLPGQAGQAVPAANFARKYVAEFPQPTQGPNGQTTLIPGDIIASIKGGFPPTEADITAEKAKQQAKIEQENTQYGANNQATNADQVKAMVDDAMRTVADTMRSDVAKKCLVYVDPQTAFSIFPGIQVGVQAPEPSTIFWAQIGLWVQQDVARAVLAMNQKSANVTEAPVKEIMKIGFEAPNSGNLAMSTTVVTPLFVYPGLTYQPGSNGAPPAPNPNGPPPPTIDPSGKLPVDYTVSPTGRESNPMFDVVHFDVDLIVDAQSVQQVIAGLEAGQYISVLQMNSMEAVDSSLAKNAGYFYGDKPCVKIHLRCEELFLRKWLEPLIPAMIKTQLNIQPPGGTPAAPGAPPA